MSSNGKKRVGGEMEAVQIADNYIAAVKEEDLKTMSKMGISTLAQVTRGPALRGDWLTATWWSSTSPGPARIAAWTGGDAGRDPGAASGGL